MGKGIQEEKYGNWEQDAGQCVSENRDSAKMGPVVDYQPRSNWFFEKSDWLTTAEAATYLRKFVGEGRPSLNAVHKLVSQGKIRRRKFAGRLYFKRKELDYLIESSGAY